MQCMVNCQPQNRKRRNKQFPVCRRDKQTKNPFRNERAHFYTLYREYRASCGASFSVSRKNCLTENVASLRSVKGATLPCDACASIPCGLAVCKQHKMLFAASKFALQNRSNKSQFPYISSGVKAFLHWKICIVKAL